MFSLSTYDTLTPSSVLTPTAQINSSAEVKRINSSEERMLLKWGVGRGEEEDEVRGRWKKEEGKGESGGKGRRVHKDETWLYLQKRGVSWCPGEWR